MVASLAAALFVSLTVAQASRSPGAPKLHDPATLQADFNQAKGAPRVVIILSPS